MSVITDSLNTFLTIFGSSSLTQQASFRGVPFITETEKDEEFGRRLAIHDYPNSSNRYAEDVGGFAGQFSVSGCVLGADAVTQYERLKAACNEKGSGELVLNVLGSYTVKCGKCSATCDTSESVERITFDLEFYLSDDVPKVDMDVVNGLGAFSLGDNVFNALSNYLNSNFGFLKADTIAALMSGDLLGMCNSLLGLSGLVDVEDLNTFNRAISTIQKNASRFLYQAENLGDMLFSEDGGAWRIMAPSAHYMPCNTIEANIFVLAPNIEKVNITISNLSPDTPEMRKAVESEYMANMNDWLSLNDGLTLKQIEQFILTAQDQSGNRLVNFQLISPAADIAGVNGTLLVAGEITWQ